MSLLLFSSLLLSLYYVLLVKWGYFYHYWLPLERFLVEVIGMAAFLCFDLLLRSSAFSTWFLADDTFIGLTWIFVYLFVYRCNKWSTETSIMFRVSVGNWGGIIFSKWIGRFAFQGYITIKDRSQNDFLYLKSLLISMNQIFSHIFFNYTFCGNKSLMKVTHLRFPVCMSPFSVFLSELSWTD